MERTWRLGWLVACALVVFAAAPAGAQLSIFPRQGLSFGTLMPGVPAPVEPTDAARRAELEIVGAGDFSLQVEVPSALISAGGLTLPLTFGAADGMVKWLKSNNTLTFQPGQTVTVRIPPGLGGAYVWIGGTAQPSPSQAPGSYAASIVVRIMAAAT